MLLFASIGSELPRANWRAESRARNSRGLEKKRTRCRGFGFELRSKEREREGFNRAKVMGYGGRESGAATQLSITQYRCLCLYVSLRWRVLHRDNSKLVCLFCLSFAVSVSVSVSISNSVSFHWANHHNHHCSLWHCQRVLHARLGNSKQLNRDSRVR